MPELTIRPGAANEETIPKTIKWERTREVGKMRRAVVTVERSDANAVTLNEKEDDIQLGNIDTLRLVDIESGGATQRLILYSYEWLANTVEPTDGGDTRTGSDADLVTDWITDVSQWTAGTVTEQATGLRFVFNHAAPHEGLRRIEKNVPGELKFRNTGTVDYIDRLGADKSHNVILSSGNQNIEDEITITKRGRELDGTHIRVLGAHEGESQFFANLVPSDDSATYENRVNYSTSRWSDGDTRDWDRFVNKDVTDQATIEEEAAELGTEITNRLVEAKVTTTLDLDIGDTVQVTKPDGDLDRAMRVHRIKEVSEGGTTTRELLLSTRTIVRSDDSQDLRDIQRFNSGFQGSSVVVQGGGSRQPVDATNNAEIPFFYPELEFENEAQLFVRGLNYRHYSTPNQHNHDVRHPTHDHDVTHPTHDHDVTHPSHKHKVSDTSTQNTPHGDVDASGSSISSPGDTGGSWDDLTTISVSGYEVALVWVGVTSADSTVQVRLKDNNGISKYPTSNGVTLSGNNAGDVTGSVCLSIPKDVGAISVQYKTDSAPLSNFLIDYQTWGNHTHDISDTSTAALGTTETSTNALGTTETSATALGITTSSSTTTGVTAGIEETNDTPSSVDVKIAGNTVATDIGTGGFRTTVDLSGELTKGAWNLIELTSDDLGHIQGTILIRGYDQIGAD